MLIEVQCQLFIKIKKMLGWTVKFFVNEFEKIFIPAVKERQLKNGHREKNSSVGRQC
jgi:hypothetical protein